MSTNHIHSYLYAVILLVGVAVAKSDDTEESSGDDPENISPATPSSLTTLDIAIISTAAIVVIILFLSYLAYATCQHRRLNPRATLIRLAHHPSADNTDESMLYMVDYDEVDINHGKLMLNNSDNKNPTV